MALVEISGGQLVNGASSQLRAQLAQHTEAQGLLFQDAVEGPTNGGAGGFKSSKHHADNVRQLEKGQSGAELRQSAHLLRHGLLGSALTERALLRTVNLALQQLQHCAALAEEA